MFSISTQNDSTSQKVVVKPSSRLMERLLAPAALVIWMMGLLSLVQNSADIIRSSPYILVYGAGALWLVLGIVLIMSIMWEISGQNLLLIDNEKLIVRKMIGSISIVKKKMFYVKNIEHMKLEQRTYHFRGNASVKYVITFHYQGRNQQLLTFLSQQQAEALMNGPLSKFATKTAGY